MLEQARHQLNKITGAGAVIQLVGQQFVPGGGAGAGRPRQRKKISAVGDARNGARLQRRSAYFLKGDCSENLAETVQFFFK